MAKPDSISACCGTYDGALHEGHKNFLKTAMKQGALYVFIVPDEVVRRNKQREPLFAQGERIKHVKALRLVTQVIPLAGSDQEQLAQVLSLQPQVYCFSDDQTTPWDNQLEILLVQLGTRITRIPRYKPDNYSTTKLYF